MMSYQSGKKATILLVDDEPINIKLMEHMLAKHYYTHWVSSGQDAIAFCQDTPPDLVLLDIEMPGMDGYETCRQLQHHELTHTIPVIFITAHDEKEEQDACWEAGCVDFITKSFTPTTLLHHVKAHLNLKFMADELREMALKDGLTGQYNRHYFDQNLISQKRLAVRNHAPLSLLMVDVDYFKQFNDMYGHLAGDTALKQVAQTLSLVASRPTDTVARFGGEEFAIILPDTDSDGAKNLAKQILDAIVQLEVAHLGSPLKMMTVSIGLVSCAPGSAAFDELIHQADSNMYLAKKLGRNCYHG